LIYDLETRRPAATQDQVRIGVDDTFILPLVVIVFFAKTLYQTAFVMLPLASTFVFALLLRVMASPLLVATTAGDGMAWLIKRLANLAPLSGAKREAWYDVVDRRWSGLRQRISYKSIVMLAQNVLQQGSAWVFQRCAALSPQTALLVIACVMLWLPLSAAISIGMHAFLLANAASLPAWMQLLHPVAAIIAKSKLLFLPVYPAAWQQAKNHAWVQTTFRCVHRMAELATMRKTAHRYQQIKQVLSPAGDTYRCLH
jgi:hypothetical protein